MVTTDCIMVNAAISQCCNFIKVDYKFPLLSVCFADHSIITELWSMCIAGEVMSA